MAASNQHVKHDSFISLDIEEEDHDLVIENYPLCKFLIKLLFILVGV